MRILGIDPGCYGALALLSSGVLADVRDMPVVMLRRGKTDKPEVDGAALAAFVRSLRPDIAVLERVGGLPGQSAPAAFNFGRAAGAVEYTLTALGVRVESVAPATWKKALRVNPGKDGSRALAARMWPAQAALFARAKDDGRAEAALIAEWGRRVFDTEGRSDDIFA